MKAFHISILNMIRQREQGIKEMKIGKKILQEMTSVVSDTLTIIDPVCTSDVHEIATQPTTKLLVEDLMS